MQRPGEEIYRTAGVNGTAGAATGSPSTSEPNTVEGEYREV